MNAKDLLRRVLEAWDDEFQNIDNASIFSEIRTYLSTTSDDAEEPVEFKFIPTGKELLRYHPDEDCIETKVEFANYPAGSKFYPPKPAEPEAEPVAWIKRQYAGTGNVLTSIFYCPEPGAIPLYTKPAKPEAETIETLKAENFKLASGQCTEEGPWGDEGGTPYCKYAEPEARKPMTGAEIIQGVTVDTSDDFHAGYWAGVRFAEKHHGIGGGE